MRIVGGDLGGRRLVGPASSSTRATTDKVREAIFNSLVSLIEVDGSAVVDLFAGTGAWGVEALSRGASRCTFVEKSPRATQVVRQNIEQFSLLDRAVVRTGDALAFLEAESAREDHDQFDVVFADPPYGFTDWARIFRLVRCEVLICETDQGDFVSEEELAATRWRLFKQKRYGTTWVSYFVKETGIKETGEVA